MATRCLDVSLAGDVAILTVERPEPLDALDPAAIAQARDVVAELGKNPAARSVLLRGLGGAPRASMATPAPGETASALLRRVYAFNGLLLELMQLTKPTVAVLSGATTGITCNLALACDFRVAEAGAVLGQSYVRAGLPPHGGASYLWLELAGLAPANEVLLAGATVDAARALRLRLVNRVVPTEELEQAALELAEELARGAPLAIAMAKGIAQSRLRGEMEAQLEAESYALATALLGAGRPSP